MDSVGSVLPSSVLLDRTVRLDKEAIEDESEWAVMECTHWNAYGCDDDIKNAAKGKGLALLARLAEPPELSALSIHLKDAAVAEAKRRRRRVHSPDLAVLPILVPEAPLDLPSYVEFAGDDVIVIDSKFSDHSHYYLVYDAVDKSLSMIPRLLESYVPYATSRPLPVRGAGGYSLALLARDVERRDVLRLWPPPPSSRSRNIRPWQIKNPLFPAEMPNSLKADWRSPSEAKLSGPTSRMASSFAAATTCSPAVTTCRSATPRCRRSASLTTTSASRGVRCTWTYAGQLAASTTPSSSSPSAVAPVPLQLVTMWKLAMETKQWRKDCELRVASIWEM